MERRYALTLFIMILGCGDSTRSPEVQHSRINKSPAIERATTRDFEVLAAALEDFALHNDIPPGRSNKRLMVVNSKTPGRSLSILSDQMSFEFTQEKWQVPEELQDDLQKRNERPCSLKNGSLGKNVVEENLDEFEKDDPVKPHFEGTLLFNLQKRYPGVEGYAWLWLPGYAKNRTTAVVRFSFGPTAHGAAATYLLVRKDGKWNIQNRHFAYYG
jgi:hypothetical protein